MERSTLKALCLVVAFAALVAVPALTAYAAEPPAAKPDAAAKPAAPAANATASPEEQKMMDAMMKAGTPGKPHQDLAKQAGSWDLAVKVWMKPGAPPQESKGTAERTTVVEFYESGKDGKEAKTTEITYTRKK